MPISSRRLSAPVPSQQPLVRRAGRLVLASVAGYVLSLAAACSTLVRIPMKGGAESLNVAIATGLMLFEAQKL